MKTINEAIKIAGYTTIVMSVLFIDSESYVMLKMSICFFIGVLLIFLGGGIGSVKKNQ